MTTRIREAVAGDYDGAAALPEYDRAEVTAGIVHFGVGGFHRSHQAAYIDALLRSGLAREWGICGVGILDADSRMRYVVRAQDGLYTVLSKSPDGTIEARVIGSMVEYLYVPDDPDAVIEKLAHPDTRIVTMTVTEGGYNIDPATREFDPANPVITGDAASDGIPRTHFRLLHEGLRRRRDRGIPPFTIASCDNIHGNGDVARRTLVEYIALSDPEFSEWVAENVTFPNSMVDRITPVTVDADRALVAERFGIEDAWPVPAEDFTQWVLEDRFPTGRPPLEEAGVQLVDDVIPYEMMKMRLLNAGHQVVGLLGAISGYEYVHEAMQDPAIRAAVARFQEHEAEPTLPPVPGIDLAEYRQTLLDRFTNPEVGDTIARLSSQTSNGLPVFVLPVVRDQLAAGGPITIAAALLAAWAVRAEERDGVRLVDRRRDLVHARAIDPDPQAFIRDPELFGDLAADDRLAAEFARWRAAFTADGVGPTLQRLTS